MVDGHPTAHQGSNGVWYPCWRYNRAGSSVQVEDEAGDRALEGEWFDHPPAEDEVDERFLRDGTDDMVDEEANTKKKKKK